MRARGPSQASVRNNSISAVVGVAPFPVSPVRSKADHVVGLANSLDRVEQQRHDMVWQRLCAARGLGGRGDHVRGMSAFQFLDHERHGGLGKPVCSKLART